MRVTVAFLCLLLSTSGTAFSEEANVTKNVFQINANSGTWSGDSSPGKKGGQNLVYFSLAHLKSRYGVTFLGSYAETSFLYNGAKTSDFHLGTLLDSTLSGFYKMDLVGGLSIRGGLDLILPTGHSNMTNQELGALLLDRAALDLNLVSSYGKGLSIAPNLVISKSISSVVLGFGLRYERTGKYDPTSEVSGDDYDPGDLLTFIMSSQYSPSSSMLIMVDLATTMSGRDEQAGQDVFKLGTIYSLDVRMVRQYELFRATYSISYSTQEKNQSLGIGGITTEDRNSNTNFYQLFVNISYPFINVIKINGILGYKNVLGNGYGSNDALYDAGYSKIYFGGGATFTVSKKLFWSVDLRYFQLNNGADFSDMSDLSDPLNPKSVNYSGFNLDIGLVYTFGG